MSLTASPDDQFQLLELQNLDTKLNQLGRTAETLPQREELVRVGALLDEATRLSSQTLGVVEDLRAEIARIESDVAVVEARMARDVSLAESTSSAKDATGLNSEIASLARRRDELEDIQLAAMQKLEDAEAESTANSANRTALETECALLRESLDEARATLDAERDTVAASRAALAATLPGDLLALYEKQRARYGYGASLLQRRISQAAGVQLAATELAAIRDADPEAVLLCPESQAILIRTAESGL